jgi:hypothetical protein
MPTLHEWQTAMRRSLVDHEPAAACAMLARGVPPERLDLYRNTFVLTLTRALRLSFPAVAKLVGDAFFESVAQLFIAGHPPHAAWLDRYGGAFPEFLRGFAPAASVPYLGDVAELEWAVQSALHAAQAEPIDPAALAGVAPDALSGLRFLAEPSLALLRPRYPADAIWRAVLLGDDGDLATLDLASGPVHLLVARREEGVAVDRLDGLAWQFLARLCARVPLAAVLAGASDTPSFDVTAALAEHLAAGRFCDFELTGAAAVEVA